MLFLLGIKVYDILKERLEFSETRKLKLNYIIFCMELHINFTKFKGLF